MTCKTHGKKKKKKNDMWKQGRAETRAEERGTHLAPLGRIVEQINEKQSA